MRLTLVDAAMEVCKEHLNASGSMGTEIEAFLTRYLLVLTCAAFEEMIEALVIARAEKSQDVALATFVRSTMGQLFRSMKSGEIAGLLGRFGEEHRRRFQEEMRKNERAETFFNNIVANRHGTAHSVGSNLTFSELLRFYEEGHTVLDAVKSVLDQS